MSISQWTRILTENELTMENRNDQQLRKYIPSRTELLFPHIDWEQAGGLADQKGFQVK